MLKKQHLFILFLVVIAGGYYLLFYRNDARAIAQRFDQLAENLSKTGDEQPIDTLKKIRKIESLLAQNCRVSIESSSFDNVYTAREVAQRVAGVRQQYRHLTVKFYDLSIDRPSEKTATVLSTVRVTGVSQTMESVPETREIEFRLDKIDGQWLFAEAKEVRVLEK